MHTICIFGDSITWGAMDPLGGGWANRLRNYFEAQAIEYDYPVDKDIDVYNLGVSANNTEDLRLRFEAEAAARQPDVIIFAIGINDTQFVRSKGGHRISLAQFRENMQTLLHSASNYTSSILVVGLTRVDESKTVPVPWNIEKEYKNSFIEIYDESLQDIATKMGAHYINIKGTVLPEELPDGLHPNSAGHQKIFEMVRNTLLSLET